MKKIFKILYVRITLSRCAFLYELMHAVIPDADLAQLVERPSHTRNVVSSSLTVGKTSLIRPPGGVALQETHLTNNNYKHTRVYDLYIYNPLHRTGFLIMRLLFVC